MNDNDDTGLNGVSAMSPDDPRLNQPHIFHFSGGESVETTLGNGVDMIMAMFGDE